MNIPPPPLPSTNNSVIVNPTHIYEEQQHPPKTDLDTVIEQLTEEINEVEKGISNTYYDTVPKQPGTFRNDVRNDKWLYFERNIVSLCVCR